MEGKKKQYLSHNKKCEKIDIPAPNRYTYASQKFKILKVNFY